jgi:hypothetical protein
MPIVIHPSLSSVAAQAAVATPVVLQPGSVISARVLQVLDGNAVRIAIGGQPIDVLSQVPLQAGQTLQLSVSQASDGSVRLAVVDAQAGASGPSSAGSATATTDSVTLAPNAAASLAAQITSPDVTAKNQLTPPEVLAVSVAAQAAAIQQTSLGPLFANLSVAAGLDNLPPQLQLAVAQVLSQRTSLDPNLSGSDIKQAFQSSGLFLEASLAATSVSSAATAPDLKAALIVLRQVLTTSLSGAPATQSPPATQGPLVTQTTAATQGAPAMQGAQAIQGATPAAGTLPQQGAATVVVLQPGTAPTAAVIPPGVPLPGVGLPQGGTPAALAPAPGTPALIPVSSQPAIIVVPETPVTASPALAPLLATEATASRVVLTGAAAPAAQGVPGSAAANQIISPPALSGAAVRAVESSAALNLLQEALQAGPPTAANPSALAFENSEMLGLLPALTGARSLPPDDAEFARANGPPPPIGGALPAAQPVTAATLVSNAPLESAMHRLLADTDGAIARQTLLQVASLPAQADTATGRIDQAAPRWNFEIPFVTPRGTAMAQFEISRDGGGSELAAAKRVWRARFSLDVEPAGPVHALVSLSGETTSVRMWAERPATAAQLRAGAAQLGQALSMAELRPGDIVIRDGTPPQSAPARAGHFLNRAL